MCPLSFFGAIDQFGPFRAGIEAGFNIMVNFRFKFGSKIYYLTDRYLSNIDQNLRFWSKSRSFGPFGTRNLDLAKMAKFRDMSDRGRN